MGKLIPFVAIDCLPNDKFLISNLSTHKAQPMIAPLMHQIDIMTQYYFVPYRILWENWVEFITGGEDGTAAPVFPTMKAPAQGIQPNTLFDYFGMPINQPEIEFSAMLARAYTKIWNDHYKVDDIENDLPLNLSDGLDIDTNRDLLNANWARDKFTRAKPFTQRGEQISVPVIPSSKNTNGYAIYKPTYNIGTPTNVKPTTTELGLIKMTPNILNKGENSVKANIISANIAPNIALGITEGYIRIIITEGPINGNFGGGEKCPINLNFEFYVPITDINFKDLLSYSNAEYLKGKVDLNISPITSCVRNGNNTVTYVKGINQINNINISDLEFTINQSFQNAGAINIRDLRISSALQRYQEKSLKYGAEYEDYCRMEFGVKPKDSRLQKSQWLGGSQSVLQISEVFQTSDSTNTPLGAQAGYGIGSLRQRRIYYRCPEHGIIIGLLSYRPTTIYTQGIERAWLKRQRFDYYTREFQGIGAQEILEQELFATKDNAGKIFGYDLKGNYQEYRKATSHVSGNFRTDLTFWHLGRIFEQAPVLNSSFLKMKPRKDIFAIQDETLPAFLTYIQNRIIAYRPMPKRIKNILK